MISDMVNYRFSSGNNTWHDYDPLCYVTNKLAHSQL